MDATHRWRFDLSYDGSFFRGFASQPGQVTVVSAVQDALVLNLQLAQPPLIVGAGRTDAGVHAFAQVLHVDLPTALYRDDRGNEAQRLMHSLNRQLEGRIVIHEARIAPPEFNARHDATWRAYRYLVIETKYPALALSQQSSFSWAVPGPLDIDAMNRATSQLVGSHDFRSFCRRPDGSNADDELRRIVLEATWSRLADTWHVTARNESALRFDIRASSFCHQMVRSLVGTLVAVGRGRLDENAIKERLLEPSRVNMPDPAPAGGLSLVGVGYSQFAGGASGFVS